MQFLFVDDLLGHRYARPMAQSKWHRADPGKSFLRGTSMSTLSVRRAVAGLVIGLLWLAVPGCNKGSSNNKLEGIYHGTAGGPITITLKGGKATVQLQNDTKTLDYKVEGNKLKILNPQEGDVEFTINEDGTLTGQLGVMSKNAS